MCVACQPHGAAHATEACQMQHQWQLSYPRLNSLLHKYQDIQSPSACCQCKQSDADYTWQVYATSVDLR